MITRLHLKNFKNFRDATLELGPLTVLVGTNASGKSNLRDAFRFIHGMSRGYNLAEIIGEKYGEGGVLQWTGIRGGNREIVYHGQSQFSIETTLELLFKNEEEPYRDGYTLRFAHTVQVLPLSQQGRPRVIHEELREVDNVVNGVVYDAYKLEDEHSQKGAEDLFVRFPNQTGLSGQQYKSSKPVLGQLAVDSIGPDYRRQVPIVSSELESMRFLDLAPEAMRKPSFPGQVVLSDRGENLSSVIQAICEDKEMKQALAQWISELTPQDVVDFDFVADQTGKILLTLIEANGQRTSAYSASDGTLRFLAMIAAILGPDAANFYFLEELDNGIHPTRLYLLLQLIEQYAKQGKVQVVATTHSPQMLAMLSEEAREHASLVYRLADEPEGRICRIMDIPEAKSVLENQNLARLHESGWLENAVAFAESEETPT